MQRASGFVEVSGFISSRAIALSASYQQKNYPTIVKNKIHDDCPGRLGSVSDRSSLSRNR